ncbi:two-component system OmpR family sensor kinase [Paraburkholderia sp. GAS199]|uniref:sensor histidine kinase n=1 Tax=Paraburkholderia sp. GAS199 TaxID=3035126 RepID=UPI003D1AA9C0
MLKSLRNQLVIALGLVVSLFAIAQGVSSYQFCVAGMSAVLDLRMEQVASRMRGGFGDSIPAFPARGSQDARDIFIVIWKDGETVPVRSTEPSLTLPRDADAGFTSPEVNGEGWRLYTSREGDRTIQIAQRLSVRHEIEEAAATRTLWPIVVLIPLVWVAVIVVVSRSLRHLNQLGKQAQRIDANRLQALPLAGVPTELLPFVRSINLMIQRLARSIESERKFISDAAHELRTPLTALQLQADNLQRDIAPSNQERFRALQGGIARSSNLISQLLRLARADAPPVGAGMARAMESVDVGAAVVDAIADVLPIAMQRGIDIGADEMADARVHAIGLDIATVIKNLVGNAVRYTPDGGKIDLSTRLRDRMVEIEVADTGPGIDEALLPRVFDRFFRANTEIEGSGLGLSIVKAIVTRYGGTVSLRNRNDGQSGIVATVGLPLEADSATQP